MIFTQNADPSRKAIDATRRAQVEKEDLNKLTTEKRWLREYVYRDVARYWYNPNFDCTDLWSELRLNPLITNLSGHWPHYEEPALFVARVKEWRDTFLMIASMVRGIM